MKKINKYTIYAIFRITNFINLEIVKSELEIKKSDLIDIYENFQKRPEKGVEILRTPAEVYYNYKNGLGGDCDDYTTIISYIAHKLKIKFRYVFVLKNNKAFHIYPELFIKNKWVSYDIWNINYDKNIYEKVKIFPAIFGFNDGNIKIYL